MTLLDKYADLVKEYGWDDRFVRFSFMAVVGALLSRNVWLYNNALGYVYPTMYILFVGPPACKKTSCADFAVREFYKQVHDHPPLGAKRMTPAALIKQLKDSAAEQGDEPYCSPLFVFAGEFGVFFKDIGGGSVTDLLLSMYDPTEPGGKWENYTVKDGKVELVNPGLTILGCTTPKEVQDSRFSQTGGLGLTSRFIIVTVPHFVAGCEDFPPINQTRKYEIRGELERISEISGPFEWTEEAREENRKIKREVDKFHMENPGTSLRSNYMARKQHQVQKLAICFSAMRDSKKIITRQDMLEARKLIEMTEDTMLEAFGMNIEYRDKGLSTKIMDKIPERGKISEQDLLKQFANDSQAVPTGKEYEDAVNGLVRAGFVTLAKDKKGMVYFERKG